MATISAASLELKENGQIDVINLKFDKNQTDDFAETSDHIFLAYHMNKSNWITIWLDGTLPRGDQTLLLGLAWLWTGALTTPD